MHTILQQIIDRTRAMNARRFPDESYYEFIPRIRRESRSLAGVLRQRFTVIAEIKKASPSKGLIRSIDDPVAIARSYERNGAGAISVVTEPHFFKGVLGCLSTVRKAVSVPVLRKDFLIHPGQIYQSYRYGADVVLIIVACVNDTMLGRLHTLALRLGMETIIEVHTLEELERAVAVNPLIIGINNRDLHTFHCDIETSLALIRHVPGHIPVVSESALTSHRDMVAVKDAGCAGCLVGESFLRAADPAAALEAFING